MEIFSRVSKVILACLGFPQLRFVIGKENSRHPLNQSDAKLKTIATLLLAFSRASRGLLVLTLSPHWLVLMLIFVLICHWSKGAKRLILRLKRIEKNFPNNRRKRRTVMYFSRVPFACSLNTYIHKFLE